MKITPIANSPRVRRDFTKVIESYDGSHLSSQKLSMTYPVADALQSWYEELAALDRARFDSEALREMKGHGKHSDRGRR